jgi:hypothetical protein
MGAMLGDISNTVPSLGQAAMGGVTADPQSTPEPLTGGKWGGAMMPGMTPITGNPTPGQTTATGPGQQPAIQYPVPQSQDGMGGFPPPNTMPGGPQPTPQPGMSYGKGGISASPMQPVKDVMPTGQPSMQQPTTAFSQQGNGMGTVGMPQRNPLSPVKGVMPTGQPMPMRGMGRGFGNRVGRGGGRIV